MSRLPRRLVALALAAGPLLLPVAGWAQHKRDPDLGDKQRDLQQTQKQLREERQKAADARRREAGVLSEL